MPLYSAFACVWAKRETSEGSFQREGSKEKMNSAESPLPRERPQMIKMHSKAAFQRLEILKGR